MSAPNFYRVRQSLGGPCVDDVEAETRKALIQCWGARTLKGDVAITAGSRGIANIVLILKTVIDEVRRRGGDPFVIPAMGSHGGATAEGQQKLLESLGISSDILGCPIRSSMEVVELDSVALGESFCWDTYAHGADEVVVVNRVKPHTSFHGEHESGLLKMLVVGLGKAEGARRLHAQGLGGLKWKMPTLARELIQKKTITGLGIVENAKDETMVIQGGFGDDVIDLDQKLLLLSKENMPRLPLTDIDILMVDQMGKNISGTGMDTNVIGRLMIHEEPEPVTPRIKRITCHRLTSESHGNATGVGLADVIGPHLYRNINLTATYKNVLTTGFLQRAKVPMAGESDRETLIYAARSLYVKDLSTLRICRMLDTLHCESFWMTAPCLDELRQFNNIVIEDSGYDLFDEDGQLRPFQ